MVSYRVSFQSMLDHGYINCHHNEFHVDYNFVAAGREDSNVRMLGNGRPFYFEIMNPRKPFLSRQELDDTQKEINETKKDLIQISHLTMITE